MSKDEPKSAKDLSLNEVLRYVLSGGVFVSTALVCRIGSFRSIGPVFTEMTSLPGAAASFALALLVGSILYATHRAIIYPVIYRVLLRRIGKALGDTSSSMIRPFRWYPEPAEIEADLAVWRARATETSPIRQIGEWAAQVHFLYTASLAMFLGIVVNLLPGGNVTLRHSSAGANIVAWVSLSVALLLGFAGFHSNARLAFVVRYVVLGRLQTSVPAGQPQPNSG